MNSKTPDENTSTCLPLYALNYMISGAIYVLVPAGLLSNFLALMTDECPKSMSLMLSC